MPQPSKRRVIHKVHKSFNSSYKDLIDSNYDMVKKEPAGTLFDNDYLTNIGKQNHKNPDEITRHQEYRKQFD